MKKIYQIRRTSFILTVFVLGTVITGQVPTWVSIGFPTAVMWLFMIYDEAMFELKEQKRCLHHFPLAQTSKKKNENVYQSISQLGGKNQNVKKH